MEIQSTTDWLSSLPSLQTIQHAVFVSKHAIAFFFETLKQNHLHWPASILITVLGQGSAQTLKKYGLQAHFVPIIPDSEHVLLMPHLQSLQNQSILLIKGESGRDLLETRLQERGAKVHNTVVYTRALPQIKSSTLTTIWQNDAVDIILFTSQQAMINLFTLLGSEAHSWIQHKPCLVISPRLAEAAEKLGICTIITSHYEQLLNALEGFKHDSR